MDWFLRVLAVALLIAAPAFAREPAPQPAIAMHGVPKYAAGFDHLDYADPQARTGGTLRLAQAGSFDNVNPFSVRGNLVKGMSQVGGVSLATESLMVRSWDEPFSLYGLLARSITTPEDRSWVEFTLNPAAHWTDGTPVTAEDVLFSWQKLRDHGRPNHRRYYSKVNKAYVSGPGRVRFEFDTSAGIDRELPLIMGLMPILCKAWWQGRDVGAPMLDIPVTSGPYRLSSLDPGREAVYTRDPAYWGRNLPINRFQWNFDKIIYDYYRDESIALEAFKAGAYDLRREQNPIKWLSGYDMPALATGQVVREDIVNQRVEPLRGLIFNTRRSMFADERVREALSLALDFEWMNKALFGEIYQRASSIYPNSELAAQGVPEGQELAILTPYRNALPAELFTRPFTLPTSDGSGPAGMRANYRKALALLSQAGYTLKNGSLQKSGQPLQFEILLGSRDEQKIALEFARSLKRLGILAGVRLADSAQFQARLTEFEYDMTLNFWSSTLSPGNEQLYYWSSSAADTPGSRNYAGVRDEVVDVLAGSLASAPDRATLVANARALDRVLMWGHYVIPLYYFGRDLVAYRSTLARPEVTSTYGILPEQTWWQRP